MVEIGLVVFEIQKAEFGNFTVPVNNTLVCLASSFGFLAADTLLCVLMITLIRLLLWLIALHCRHHSYAVDHDDLVGHDQLGGDDQLRNVLSSSYDDVKPLPP